jgi:hypothetical protein
MVERIGTPVGLNLQNSEDIWPHCHRYLEGAMKLSCFDTKQVCGLELDRHHNSSCVQLATNSGPYLHRVLMTRTVAGYISDTDKRSHIRQTAGVVGRQDFVPQVEH